jgi:hypothetical protein
MKGDGTDDQSDPESSFLIKSGGIESGSPASASKHASEFGFALSLQLEQSAQSTIKTLFAVR